MASALLGPTQAHLTRLPGEIHGLIRRYLSNRDVKNLRLTAKFFHRIAHLRIDRVFISANPLNIAVFEAIAQHDVYRAQVTEIVWDDALLPANRREYHNLDEDEEETVYWHEPIDRELGTNESDEEDDTWPRWFRKACEESLMVRYHWESVNHKRPDIPERERQFAALLPLGESWEYYQDLLRQQQGVLESGGHIRALEAAIDRFPSLRKIIITDATHGRLFTPLYDTPMIRSFPRGFNYPLPGRASSEVTQPACVPWDETGRAWQGFRVMMDLLAQNRDAGRVTELQVNAFPLRGGLNYRLFEEPCETLTNFQTVLRQDDFESLHLDLQVDADDDQIEVFNGGLLRQTLACAAGGKGLKRLALATNNDGPPWSMLPYPSLQTLLDPSNLQRLEHLSLSRIPFRDQDLVALLAALPHSIRTIHLADLTFIEGTYSSLLLLVRDTLDWQSRNPRPHLTIINENHLYVPGPMIWIEKEIDRFIYESGINPFGEGPEPRWATGYMGVIYDTFDPDYRLPNLDPRGLLDIGLLQGDPSDPLFHRSPEDQQGMEALGIIPPRT
ncbi:hypothetical protein F4808DRAFT_444478 [Astrocystis sublimbata]|nr:hypothetical protein F4808DRAFT_444478 [Astrocystis sublimbata]